MQICNSERGFTLLELMTVILLIGLLASVGLSIDLSDASNTPDQQADRLAQQFALVSQESVLAGRVFGLDFYQLNDAAGYRWLEHDGKQWQPITGTLINESSNEFTLPESQQLTLVVDGEAVEIERMRPLETEHPERTVPEILVLPTREFTPAVVELSDASGSVALQVDALGRVEVRGESH